MTATHAVLEEVSPARKAEEPGPGRVLGGTHGDLSPGPALAVMVAWTLTIFAAAAWRLRARDLV